VALSPEQAVLFNALAGKLDQQKGPEALARFMGEVLRSLLRRQGDAEFLAAIQDAFVGGMADRDAEGQRLLARQVIEVAIEIRPEIARAWQTLHARPGDIPARRDSDLLTVAAAAPGGAAESYLDPATKAERLTAAFVASAIERRLSLLRVPIPPAPSPAYCHEQPFFLFIPAFAQVAGGFVTGVLMDLCRPSLDRHIYKPLQPLISAGGAEVESFLAANRADMWRILCERLGRLATLHRKAEAKLAAAEAKAKSGAAAWKVVEIPVSRPRVFNVLGVKFAVGSRTTMKKMKVPADVGSQIDQVEMEALTLMTRFRDMAAEAGFELPDSCDFQFLRTVLSFDPNQFAQITKEYLALAGHRETNPAYLSERLSDIDKTLPNYLADALVMMLFTRLSTAGFGFQDLCNVCIGSARDPSAQAKARPFVHAEVARRPRELAFQVREMLRRRVGDDVLAASVQMLIDVWRVMPKSRFAAELDAAVMVIAAFPVAFVGDPDERLFTQIAHVLARELTAQVPDFDGALKAIAAAYRPVAAAQKASAAKTGG